MNDELTRWADAARDYKAKLDWATTGLSDILELASGQKPDPATLEELVWGAVESVRALQVVINAWHESFGTNQLSHALEKYGQAHKAAAEMRDALQKGKHSLAWCIPAEGGHTCGGYITEENCHAWKIEAEESIDHALSTDSGRDYVHKIQLDRLRDELTRLRDIVSEADAQLIDQALEEAR